MPDAKIQLFLRPVAVVHLQLLFFTHIIFVIVIVIAMQGGRATSMVLRLWRLELARAGRRQLRS